MSNTRELLGKNIKRIRDDAGLTQEALAEKAGLSIKMIQKIEYGQTSPTPETLDKVSAALSVPVEMFFEGQGPHPQQVLGFGYKRKAMPWHQRLIHAKEPLEVPTEMIHANDLFFDAAPRVRAIILALLASDSEIARPFYEEFESHEMRLLKPD